MDLQILSALVDLLWKERENARQSRCLALFGFEEMSCVETLGAREKEVDSWSMVIPDSMVYFIGLILGGSQALKVLFRYRFASAFLLF
jgi:hypothetical protein